MTVLNKTTLQGSFEKFELDCQSTGKMTTKRSNKSHLQISTEVRAALKLCRVASQLFTILTDLHSSPRHPYEPANTTAPLRVRCQWTPWHRGRGSLSSINGPRPLSSSEADGGSQENWKTKCLHVSPAGDESEKHSRGKVTGGHFDEVSNQQV